MKFLIHIPLFSAGLLPWAAACENSSVRDAAFLEARDVHRLCLVSRDGDAESETRRRALEAWLREPAAGLNVELCRAAIDDPAADWSRYGIPSAPPECPVALLAGYHTAERAVFFVDHWAPAPTREQLEEIARSPARDEIRRRASRDLAVLLHFPATSDAAPGAADALAAVTRHWSQHETGAVSILSVDRADPRERLLTAFTGVPPQGPDWVAVVFGRGKLMPPLSGPEITEPALDEQLRSLLEPCTCLRSPGVIGVDVPMVWRDDDDAAVALIHGAGATNLGDRMLAHSGDAAAGAAPPGARTRPLLPVLATLGALALVQGIAALALCWHRAAARARS